MAKTSTNWIVSKRVDLTAFIGGALAGYAVFIMHAGLHWDMRVIYLLFIMLLDTPHFFGTYLRTYLDKQEFRARRGLLLGSLLWLGSGPFTLLICYGLFELGVRNYLVPFDVYFLGFSLWAYWHVVRQHYGFMRLYQVKNGERLSPDAKKDSVLMHLGLLLPFVVFALRHPESRSAFGLPEKLPPPPASLADYATGAAAWEYYVFAAVALILSYLLVSFVFREFSRVLRGEPLNVPKVLLFTAVLPLHSVVCFSQSVLTAPLVTFSAFVTIYHDIQYHVLVYCHQRNRYRNKPDAVKEHGLAAVLSKNVFMFGASVLAFGLLVRGFGCSIQVYHGTSECFTPVLMSRVHLFGSVYSDTLLAAVFIGFPLHHYFVDQFIWKPSRDPNLQRDLKLEPARA
ncbi:MAG: hypothetical protein ACREFX_14990 [Opitutaceae bacterium]